MSKNDKPSFTYPVAVVTWTDSCSSHGGLHLAVEAAELGDITLVTTGFLMRDDKRGVCVARDYDQHTGEVREILRIPRVNVLNVALVG